MSALSENDYMIHIVDYASGEELSLGSGDFCAVKFDGVGSPELGEVTFDVSGGDGIHFGIERLRGVNWTITGAIHSGLNKNTPGSPQGAWDAWSKVSRAWIAYPQRTRARAVVPLYFQRPGRERMVVFGRPRRIDPDTERSHSGFISYTALYTQSDPRFYSSVEKSLTIQLTPTVTGGIHINTASATYPQGAFYLPFSTTSSTPRADTLANTGDSPTNPVIKFKGPVTNPRVAYYSDDGFEWDIKLALKINQGQTITIDTRQWARTVTDANGGSQAGYYRGVKMQDITILPGAGYIEYSGSDPTGTSTCELKFRNAWVST